MTLNDAYFLLSLQTRARMKGNRTNPSPNVMRHTHTNGDAQQFAPLKQRGPAAFLDGDPTESSSRSPRKSAAAWLSYVDRPSLGSLVRGMAWAFVPEHYPVQPIADSRVGTRDWWRQALLRRSIPLLAAGEGRISPVCAPELFEPFDFEEAEMWMVDVLFDGLDWHDGTDTGADVSGEADLFADFGLLGELDFAGVGAVLEPEDIAESHGGDLT